MRRKETPRLLVLAAALAVLAVPLPARAQDAGGAAPAGDRFFPKELEDAVKALTAADADEEARYDALLRISRMRPLEGATEPLKADAFAPVLARALESRQDTFADSAGAFLAALDRPRLAEEVKKAAKGQGDAVRMRNLTFLAENLGAGEGVEVLAGELAGSPAREVRVRAVEALGLLGAKEGFAAAAALMRDGDLEIRNVAALALGRIGDPKAVPLLMGGLPESKAFHGWYCADALTLIEDPSIFEGLMARPASGAGSGPRARALEGCARGAHLEQLLGLLTRGSSSEVRTAAAHALGRIAGDDAAFRQSLGPEVLETVADTLLEGMLSDKEDTVRAACLWALRKCRVDSTGPKAVKRLTQVKGEDRVLFLLTILGEAKTKEAATILLRNGILAAKEPMVRRASGVAFWQIGDPDAIREFRQRAIEAQDAGTMQRIGEALGSWRAREGFDLAIQLLHKSREGSREQFEVMLALEKMTGHWFGPYPGIWQRWSEKNPHFFTPRQSKVEREKWREEFDKENRGFRHTPETEKAVQMGLGWLARHQGWDGIWDCSGFLQKCDPRSPCNRQGGARTQFAQAGYTGLACLPFTGAGYSPSGGKFRHTIRRGLDALVATMGVEGDWADQADLLWNRSYARPLALQALAEGYAGSGDPRYRAAAERIIARQFALMNQRGGWRYSLHRAVPELDSSVSAWVVFALKASEKAGIPVPRLLWEGPYYAFDQMGQRVPQAGPFEDFVELDQDYGSEIFGKDKTYVFITGYTDASGGPGRATTPLGVMSRIFLGWKRTHPFCIGGANYIMREYYPEFDVFGEPGKEDWSKAGKFTQKALWPMYNIYYCTLALHQMGGKYFGQWNRRVSRVLPRFQNGQGCERGSWPARWGKGDGNSGWVYTTSLGVLTLETYYRYLPILQD
jgi:HEAT repeat protein